MTRRRDISTSLAVVLLAVSLFGLAACDDDNTTEPGDFNSDQLAIVPAEAAVPAGGVIDFDAEAGGENVGSAQWSLSGANSAGSITQDGTYSAPDQVTAEFTITIEAVVPTLYPEGATATLTVTPN